MASNLWSKFKTAFRAKQSFSSACATLTNENVKVLKALDKLIESDEGFILFENGTAVLLNQDDVKNKSGEEIIEETKEFLKENGKVLSEGPSGEFDPERCKRLGGWL